MHTHVKTTDCTLSSLESRLVERRLARIERMAPHRDPDLIRLSLVVARQPKRSEFRCSLRLTLGDRVLVATREHAGTLQSLLTEAFDHLETQMNRIRESRIDRRTRGSEGDVEAAITV